MPELRIDLCGPVRLATPRAVLGDGALARRQTRLALAVLVISPGPVPREVMADVLWPAELPVTWQTSLRGTIAKVRGALRALDLGDALTTADGCYVLDLPADTVVDLLAAERAVDVGEAAVAEGQAAKALSLALTAVEVAERPVLADCTGRWVEELQARHRQIGTTAVLLAADAALATGAHSDAARWAEAALRSDPCSERAARALMRALHARGDRAGALAAYEACRRQLEADLGVSPGPETTKLYVSLLGQEPEVTAIGGSHLPFVGRASELASLADSWSRTLDGEGGLVVIQGEAGAGKSRLAREAARLAHGTGGVILRGQNDLHGAPALQPFADALSSYQRQVDTEGKTLGPLAEELIRLAPIGAAATDVIGADVAPSARWRLFEAVRQWLAHAAEARPLMLVVEDLQWASLTTLRLLVHLTGDQPPSSVLIVATSRDDPVEASPRSDALTDLLRLPSSRRIRLRGLTSADVKELLDPVLASATPENATTIADQVLARTAGNALYVSEAVRHLASGDPVRRAESLPVAVADIVRLRRTSLGPGAQELLALVALAGGGGCPTDLLLDAYPGQDGLHAIQEAVGAGLLSVQGDDLGFRHELVRAAIDLDLPTTARHRIHRALAQSFARREDDRLVPQTAHHWAQVARLGKGEEPQAVPWLLASARQSMARFDFESATSWLHQAIEIVDRIDPLEARAELRSDIYLLLGEALRQAGDPGHAAAYERALLMARHAGDPVRVADAALGMGGWGAPRAALADDARVVAALEEALEVVPEDQPALRARLRSVLALERRWGGQPLDSSGALADTAVGNARATGDPAAIAAALVARYGVGERRPEGALDDVAELRRLAPSLQDPSVACSAAMMAFDAWLQLGELGRAEDELALLERLVDRSNLPYFRWIALTRRAGHQVLLADHTAAAVTIDAAMELGTQVGIDLAMMYAGRAGLLLAMALADGSIDSVRSELEVFEQLIGDDLSVRAAVTVAAAEAGDLAAAREGLDRVHDTGLAGLPDNELGVATAMNLARASARVGDERAAVLVDHLLSRSGHLSWISCVSFGPVDLGLAWAHAASGSPEEARRHLALADELAHRVGSPTWARQVAAERARPT